MIDKIKYDLTKSAPSSIYRHLPLGRTHADIVASKLSAGKGGVVPERVAGEDAAAAPDIDVAHCHGDPERPAAEFSPGKDPALDLRDGQVSPVAYYVRDINGNWQRGVDAFLNIARLCAEANARLTTAQKRSSLKPCPLATRHSASSCRSGPTPACIRPIFNALLPPHYTTTYAVTLLTDRGTEAGHCRQCASSGHDAGATGEMAEVALRKRRSGAEPQGRGERSCRRRPADWFNTRRRQQWRAPCMSDDSQDNKEELASASDNAPAREPVAPVAGPLAPPPVTIYRHFWIAGPSSPEDQRAYDAIKATLNSHVLPLWNRASAVVRERIIAEVTPGKPF